MAELQSAVLSLLQAGSGLTHADIVTELTGQPSLVKEARSSRASESEVASALGALAEQFAVYMGPSGAYHAL